MKTLVTRKQLVKVFKGLGMDAGLCPRKTRPLIVDLPPGAPAKRMKVSFSGRRTEGSLKTLYEIELDPKEAL
ncbi:hypothetical protein [Dyella telluris]|uniref:Uncharacterized protein n=1 Tax=Dyella telluris TaxID=2763498 RepID=A0A7G8Q4L5_9GAMM|nr:hypothetical protein [Dyella telluris]QNK01723.1 hypothetical protein H8F01_00640 [Dyella telluris]